MGKNDFFIFGSIVTLTALILCIIGIVKFFSKDSFTNTNNTNNTNSINNTDNANNTNNPNNTRINNIKV
jgi:hypothetical protein